MKASRLIWILVVVVFMLLAPWILSFSYMAGKMGYGVIDEWRYAKTANFSSDRWKKPDRKYRYSVLDAVVSSEIKPGMSADEVQAKLGPPDARPDGDWEYLADQPGWRFIDWHGGGLLISFTPKAMVSEVRKNYWVD